MTPRKEQMDDGSIRYTWSIPDHPIWSLIHVYVDTHVVSYLHSDPKTESYRRIFGDTERITRDNFKTVMEQFELQIPASLRKRLGKLIRLEGGGIVDETYNFTIQGAQQAYLNGNLYNWFPSPIQNTWITQRFHITPQEQAEHDAFYNQRPEPRLPTMMALNVPAFNNGEERNYLNDTIRTALGIPHGFRDEE